MSFAPFPRMAGPNPPIIAAVGHAVPPHYARQEALRRFPALAERLDGAAAESAPRGAGPLRRASAARVADRLVLVGDAAGYVAAISGEGLSVAFSCALGLGRLLPNALAAGATRRALLPYEAIFAREFGHYAQVTGGLLALARHPWLRRRAVTGLGRHPRLARRIMRWAVA